MNKTFMTAIADESDRFISAIEQTQPAAPVPSCPDWDADELLWHLTEVHAFWAQVLATGARTDEQIEQIEQGKPARPGDRAATIALFREQTDALIAELHRHADDDESAWFWLDSAQTVGSTRRMQAHEATMHRIDAELTAGVESAPVPPDLAADGIRHAVEVMWAWWGKVPGFELTTSTGAVALEANDWGESVVLQPGRWEGKDQSGESQAVPGAVLAPDAEPVARVRGTAEELYRWLWGRAEEPATEGDPAALAALRAARDEGMN